MSVTAKPSVQTQKVHIIVVVSTDIRVMVKIVQILMNARAPKQTSATPMRYVTTLMGLLCVVVSMDIKATVEVAQIETSVWRRTTHAQLMKTV